MTLFWISHCWASRLMPCLIKYWAYHDICWLMAANANVCSDKERLKYTQSTNVSLVQQHKSAWNCFLRKRTFYYPKGILACYLDVSQSDVIYHHRRHRIRSHQSLHVRFPAITDLFAYHLCEMFNVQIILCKRLKQICKIRLLLFTKLHKIFEYRILLNKINSVLK